MRQIAVTLLGRFGVAVDGVPVPAAAWQRRHATALVAVLALAPDRRLRREQVVDRLWPEEDLAVAAPRLHKAAHFARRALGVPGAVVLRGEAVLLCPDGDVTVDVDRFEALARDALATGEPAAAREALAAYGGELLPHERYADWAGERRAGLARTRAELLRLDGAWEALVEQDDSDELAHVALMQRHLADGDRHAALRQFERLARGLRRELGVGPGPEAVALRQRALARPAAPSGGRPRPPLGRERVLATTDRALRDVVAGRHCTALVTGPPGIGKTAILEYAAARARELGFDVGSGTCAPVEGAWPYAPVLEALAGLCRQHPSLLDGLAPAARGELARLLAGEESRWTGAGAHQQLFVAAAELLRLAADGPGVLGRRVAIAVAHRPYPVGDALAAFRAGLLGRDRAVEMRLAPLGPADVTALIRRYIPDPTPELVGRIAALGAGVPFAVTELARRAARGADLGPAVEAVLLRGVPPATRDVLARVAVAGATFDTNGFLALAGEAAGTDATAHLDAALAAGLVEPTEVGYRFRHALVRDALLRDLPPHRRQRVHRDAAARLAALGAPASRIGHHLLAAGAPDEAAPHLLCAAETRAAAGAYREALVLLDAVPHRGERRAATLSVRADLLNALGDPRAVAAYREALSAADPGAVRELRIRLARTALMSDDIATARAALDGLEPDGGAANADLLLARGMAAYLSGDAAGTRDAAEAAHRLVLAGERSWQVLDLVTLQAMGAHASGELMDRMRVELHRTRDRPEIAHTVFDGYLCAAEHLLYGPTTAAEIIGVARELRETARRSGARRAAAFAAALHGEAALLSGDLDGATAALGEARTLHRTVGAAGGEALVLQRLAEVALAQGDAARADTLLREALPLARGSALARHLVHRIHGTMVAAAPDAEAARAAVEVAEAALGWDDACPSCIVMLAATHIPDERHFREHLCDESAVR